MGCGEFHSPWHHKELDMTEQLTLLGTSLVVQWLRLCTPNAEGLDLIPSQGSRSHMPQPGIHMLQLKVPRATTKTRHSQIYK